LSSASARLVSAIVSVSTLQRYEDFLIRQLFAHFFLQIIF
jgi:hypothetical protein